MVLESDTVTREATKGRIFSQKSEKGRWWGPQFCQIPPENQPVCDGCYFCGCPVMGHDGQHNHTMVERSPIRYSCVCENC